MAASGYTGGLIPSLQQMISQVSPQPVQQPQNSYFQDRNILEWAYDMQAEQERIRRAEEDRLRREEEERVRAEQELIAAERARIEAGARAIDASLENSIVRPNDMLAVGNMEQAQQYAQQRQLEIQQRQQMKNEQDQQMMQGQRPQAGILSLSELQRQQNVWDANDILNAQERGEQRQGMSMDVYKEMERQRPERAFNDRVKSRESDRAFNIGLPDGLEYANSGYLNALHMFSNDNKDIPLADAADLVAVEYFNILNRVPDATDREIEMELMTGNLVENQRNPRKDIVSTIVSDANSLKSVFGGSNALQAARKAYDEQKDLDKGLSPNLFQGLGANARSGHETRMNDWFGGAIGNADIIGGMEEGVKKASSGDILGAAGTAAKTAFVDTPLSTLGLISGLIPMVFGIPEAASDQIYGFHIEQNEDGTYRAVSRTQGQLLAQDIAASGDLALLLTTKGIGGNVAKQAAKEGGKSVLKGMGTGAVEMGALNTGLAAGGAPLRAAAENQSLSEEEYRKLILEAAAAGTVLGAFSKGLGTRAGNNAFIKEIRRDPEIARQVLENAPVEVSEFSRFEKAARETLEDRAAFEARTENLVNEQQAAGAPKIVEPELSSVDVAPKKGILETIGGEVKERARLREENKAERQRQKIEEQRIKEEEAQAAEVNKKTAADAEKARVKKEAEKVREANEKAARDKKATEAEAARKARIEKELEAEQKAEQGRREEARKAESDAAKAQNKGTPMEDAVTREGIHSNWYEGTSVGIIDNWFKKSSLKKVNNYIENAIERNARIDKQMYDSLIEHSKTRNFKLDANKINALEKAMLKDTSEAASIMRMARRRNNAKIKDGRATAGEVANSMYSYIEKAGIEITENTHETIAAFATKIKEDGAALWKTKKRLNKDMDNLSYEQLGEANKQFYDMQKSYESLLRDKTSYLIRELEKMPETTRMERTAKRNAYYDMFSDLGPYMQNYVNSNLLSGLSGRLYDAVNGWQVGLIESAPTTRLVRKGATEISRKFGYTGGDVRAAPFRVLYEGAKQSLIEIPTALRERMMWKGKVGGAHTQRAVTSTAMDFFGETPINAFAHSMKQENYYSNLSHIKDPKLRKARADLEARLDMDNVGELYYDFAAKNQGLGKRAYQSLQQNLRNQFSNVLKIFEHEEWPGRGLSKNSIDVLSSAFERNIAGFFNVTWMIAKRGFSISSFGLPTFIRWAVRKDKGTREAALNLGTAMSDALVVPTMIGPMGFIMGANNMITGSYPKDAREKAYWEAHGIQEHSIKTPFGYVPIDRSWGIYGLAMEMYANMGDNWVNGRPLLEDAEKNYLSSVKSLLGIDNIERQIQKPFKFINVADDEKEFSQFLDFMGDYAAMFHPVASMSSQATNTAGAWLGLNKKDLNQVMLPGDVTLSDGWARLISKSVNKNPLRYAMLPDAKDTYGRPITLSNKIPFLGIAGVFMNNETILDKEEIMFQTELGKVITPPKKNETLTLNGEKLDLELWEQAIVNDIKRGSRAETMANIIKSKSYQELDIEGKFDFLEEAKDANSKRANQDALVALGYIQASDANEVPISTWTDIDDQGLLLRHKSKSAEQKRKDMEDNDYALSYLTAKYNNLNASGMLTFADTNMENPNSLVRKIAVAQVNKDFGATPQLIFDYGKTSETGLFSIKNQDDMLRLLEYDTALARAGAAPGQNGYYRKYMPTKLGKLKDTQYERDFYVDEYEFRRDNGLLTADDENIKTKKGAAYMAIAADLNHRNNVDFELVSLYEETNVTTWRKLVETDPELAQRLYDYDTLRTGSSVSDHDRKPIDHDKRKYDMGSSGRRGGRGGGGGSDRLHVPSVADLRLAQYFPKNNSKISTSTTKNISPLEQGQPALRPMTITPGKTTAAGQGIKTKIPRLSTAETIKYKRTTTRQPAMGIPYMDYLKGGSPQSSFKAQRENRS